MIISRESKINNIKISANITNSLIKIPMTIENPTKPSLYSFFQGLKKVFIKRGNDTSWIKNLFKEIKNLKTEIGTSKNQKRKKIIGNPK